MNDLSRQTVGVIGGGAALLLALVWTVLQGGLVTAEPGGGSALAAVLLITLDALPVVAGLWAGAAGLGYALGQRGVAQLGVGMAALLVLNYLLAWAGWMQGGVGWALATGGAAMLVVQAARWWCKQALSENKSEPRRLSWAWWCALPGVALLMVGACVPVGLLWRVEAMGYDVTSYHLQIPREWLAAGGMAELEHNVYAYFPGLIEAGYARIMAMRGGDAIASVYACQLWHASFVLLTVAAVASMLRRWVRPWAAVAGGALTALLPWTIVTGTLAYNEQAVVAFLAVALAMVLRREAPGAKAAAGIGLLAGAATLAKLTAGLTVALPLGLLVVVRGWRAGGWRGAWRPAVVCAAAGFLTLTPYLARNAAWTGNPVFPFATSLLGEGHWDAQRAARWEAAHQKPGHGDAKPGDRYPPALSSHPPALQSLWRQAIGNAGYGALGGSAVPPESRNVARFATEGGLPVLWLAALGGTIVGLIRRSTRGLTLALLLVLGWQFAWWLTMSHLQSRFLILVVLPLCALAGLLIDGVSRLPARSGELGGPLLAGALTAALGIAALTVTWSQTTPITLDDGRRLPAPLWLLVDGLPRPHGTGVMPDHTLNRLPAASRTMIVGNNQALFYVRRPMIYASAFDESPLTAPMRETSTPAELAERLREQGVTHLWIGYSELDRLHATYGFDAGVTSEAVAQRIAGWRHLTPPGPTVLVEVPR